VFVAKHKSVLLTLTCVAAARC